MITKLKNASALYAHGEAKTAARQAFPKVEFINKLMHNDTTRLFEF